MNINVGLQSKFQNLIEIESNYTLYWWIFFSTTKYKIPNNLNKESYKEYPAGVSDDLFASISQELLFQLKSCQNL